MPAGLSPDHGRAESLRGLVWSCADAEFFGGCSEKVLRRMKRGLALWSAVSSQETGRSAFRFLDEHKRGVLRRVLQRGSTPSERGLPLQCSSLVESSASTSACSWRTWMRHSKIFLERKVLQMGSMLSERELLLQRVFLVVEGAASTICALLEIDTVSPDKVLRRKRFFDGVLH